MKLQTILKQLFAIAIVMVMASSCLMKQGNIPDTTNVDDVFAKNLYKSHIQPLFRTAELAECFRKCIECGMDPNQTSTICNSFFGSYFIPERLFDFELSCTNWGKIRATSEANQFIVEPAGTNEYNLLTVIYGEDGDWHIHGEYLNNNNKVLRNNEIFAVVSIDDNTTSIINLEMSMEESNGDKAEMRVSSDPLTMPLASLGNYYEYPTSGVIKCSLTGGYTKTFNIKYSKLSSSIIEVK